MSVLAAQGQDVTFTNRYDPHDQLAGSFAYSIEVTDEGNYVVLFNAGYIDWQDSIYWSSRAGSLFLAPNGVPLDTNRFDVPQKATYVGWCNASDKRSDGSIVTGGGTVGIDALNDACIYITDPSGGLMQVIEILTPDQDQIGRSIKSVANGFVLCGGVVNAGNEDGFVMQLDFDGNVDWEFHFGGIYNDGFTSIDSRPDSGFFTGGRYRITATNREHWVVALNDTGGTIWNKVWGGPYFDNLAHVTTSADGNVLVGSARGLGTGNQVRKYIAKLHKDDGEILWEYMYGPMNEGSFYPVKEVEPGGDLITVGYHIVAGVNRGLMMRTTSEGDSIWMRDYVYYDSLVSSGQGYLRDVQPTPDGGFIAVGTTFPVPDIYSQDVWVVKVDQYGCLEPGCHLITGMETQITNMRDVLRVWPNPVQAYGQVQVELELPEHFKPQGQLKLTITSNDGCFVHEETVPNSSTTSTLQLPQLASGLYHIHLSDASRLISGAKLVVE